MKSDNWNGYVYEHIYVVETNLGRLLKEDEIVHHLDCNRSNNRLENLLVLYRGQHTKLHAWLNRGAPINENYGVDRVNSEESKVDFCKVCGITLQSKQKTYCSTLCQGLDSRKADRPSKEELKILIDNNSMVSIGKMFGVSDNAVRKWARKYNLL